MIHICDIGSWPEGPPPYQPLLDHKLGRLSQFDPQVNGYVIGDGEKATLYRCAYPGWTSLLKPNEKLLKHLPFDRAAQVVEIRTDVPTTRLNDLDIDPIDYLVMDVQGSELKILQHGRKKLHNCAVIQLEVPFLELYIYQTPFWRLDQELRHMGFMLHNFVSLKHHCGQLIDGDALYVRDFTDEVPNSIMRTMRLILDHCYNGRSFAEVM